MPGLDITPLVASGRQLIEGYGEGQFRVAGHGGGHLSTPLHDFAYHTIAFPVPSAGGDARAMRGHRQAFPTPRGSGKRDPKGGLARPPDVVARRL